MSPATLDDWEAMNGAYLAAGLAWTRERLGAADGDPDAGAVVGSRGGRRSRPRPWNCWAIGSACPGSSVSS